MRERPDPCADCGELTPHARVLFPPSPFGTGAGRHLRWTAWCLLLAAIVAPALDGLGRASCLVLILALPAVLWAGVVRRALWSPSCLRCHHRAVRANRRPGLTRRMIRLDPWLF